MILLLSHVLNHFIWKFLAPLPQMPGNNSSLTRRRGSDRSLSGSAHELAVCGVNKDPTKVVHSHSQSNLSEIPYRWVDTFHIPFDFPLFSPPFFSLHMINIIIVIHVIFSILLSLFLMTLVYHSVRLRILVIFIIIKVFFFAFVRFPMLQMKRFVLCVQTHSIFV